ncbi:MAG: 2-amino-4-hydroxy-6-hydroxymethyldihydropteridine diphosphokinase [Syntrophus sp. (in: bacteria)]|nr:2-amino-4-hydroxy-6-hydroxymethyldihydropteridine diphosphokinase [Syntrophus sp. (in: bacteria)]
MDKKILIGIGSNIGNGIKNCMAAIKKISSDKRVNLKVISSFYTTSPVSEIKQDDFINCAVLVSWEGTPHELLQFLTGIENSMGRTREIKDGPRIIDLDILLFGDRVLDEPSLTIPHKELHKRKFSLMPCLEIDPNFIIPTYKRPLNDFLPEIGDDQVVTKLEGIVFLEESEE